MFPTAISLEQYEILRELSKNDGGATYKALARENQSKVAVRVVVPGPGTSPDLAAIKHLAAKACALSSPYIVRTLESFEKDGAVYLVMEYTEGSFLSAALGTAKISDWDMADFARQMCSAVDHAASLNIFHPNLHPANIIQEWDGTVKLLDYGVAADVVQRANMNPSWVRALQYVSPEQVRREPPDRRSNLFSLGVVLYEMVTGQNPFAGTTPAAIIEQITNKTPAAPSVLVRNVPAALSEILMKALAKSPEERYQTGAELLYAIEHYRDQQTVAPKPTVAAAELKPPVARTVTLSPERPSFAPPPVATPSPEPVFRPPVAAATPVVARVPVSPKQAAPVVRPTPTPPVAKAMPPAQPQAPPKPTTPALKPTPRSEFLIIGPKKEDPADTAVVSAPAKQPVTATKQQPSANTEAVAGAAPAVPKASVTPAATVEASLVAAAQSAREKAPAVTARVVPKVAVSPAGPAVPVEAAHPAPSAQVAKANTSTKTNNRLILILGGVGALAVVVLGAVLLGLYLGRSRNATQEQKPAPPPAPVQQPLVEVQAPVQETPAPQEPEPVRKKKQKEAPKPVVASVPVIGTAYVSTTPEGAMIEVDGQATSFVTPKALFNLSAGSHAIRVTKAGFEPASRTVEVQGGQTASVNIALAELRATLAISSYPDGAAITINGEKTGRVTPATVSLVKGRYIVILQKDGYVPSENTLEVFSGQNYRLAPHMSAMGNADAVREVGKFKKLFGGGGQAEMGKVQFRTTPKGAQVTANGKIMKKQTPTELLFPGGVYELVFTLPGYKPARRTITVTENSNQIVDVPLERENK